MKNKRSNKQSHFAHVDTLENRTLFSGGLDPTFGTGGYINGPQGPGLQGSSGNFATLQSDGKLLFVGTDGSGHLAVHRYLANGAVDLSFGSSGVTVLGAGNSNGTFIGETASGKIDVAGDAALYQLTASGKADSTFGKGGRVSLPDLSTYGFAVEGNQILVSGTDYSAALAGKIERFNPNGRLDTTFGSAGTVAIAAPANGSESFGPVFITPSGDIVAGNTSTTFGATENVYTSSIYEFNKNGSPVTTFGTNGIYAGDPTMALQAIEPDGSLLITTFAYQNPVGGGSFSNVSQLSASGSLLQKNIITAFVDRLAVEPDGTLLVGGSQPGGDGYTITHYGSTIVSADALAYTSSLSNIIPTASGGFIAVDNLTLSIYKFTAAGAPDLSYGIRGLVTPVQMQPPASYQAVAVQSDRKVIAGGLTSNGTNEVFALTRYNVDGSLDTSFGSAGSMRDSLAPLDVQSLTIFVQPDGKIVAAVNIGNSPPLQASVTTGFAVIRFNTNGTLDKTFGTAGTVTFSADSDPSLLWQAGKLLIGSANTVRRLNSNGSLDSTFQTGVASGSVMAVTASGKILVDHPDGTTGNALLSRYNADGTLDTNFAVKGVQTEDAAIPQQLIVESNGTIVAVLGTVGFHKAGPSYLQAFTSSGALDTVFGSDGTLNNGGGGLVQQPNGQILDVQGYSAGSGPPFIAQGVLIYRYSANGVLDTTFGQGGSVKLVPDNPVGQGVYTYTVGSTAALDSAGRLLLAGGEGPNTANIFALDTNNDTGTIAGYMFYDFNGNGVRDPGDHALNWTCYIDVDNDGHYDNADIRIHTDAAGNFTIPNLAPGVYHIRQSQVSHWQKTTPAEYTVTVTPGATVTGVNFGSRFIT